MPIHPYYKHVSMQATSTDKIIAILSSSIMQFTQILSVINETVKHIAYRFQGHCKRHEQFVFRIYAYDFS